jgi:copper chaperone CopZ
VSLAFDVISTVGGDSRMMARLKALPDELRGGALKHDGILDVRANVAADLLLVDYEADKVSLEDILAVIRKTGYKALPIR